ncbi:MAG: c-type cytochrome, partial [Maribacter sp.]
MKKVNYRNLPSQLSLLLLALTLTFSTTLFAQDDPVAGKALFNANCAACHKMDKKAVGPALRGVAEKYDKEWLYKWIRNSQELIKSGDALAVTLFAENNNSVMTAFPALSDTDIDNILAYTSEPKPEPKVAEGGPVADGGDASEVSNNIILGALALVFLLLVTLLYLVTGTLRKIAAANGVDYEEDKRAGSIWKAFVKNQFLVLVFSIFLLLGGAYFAYGWMMQVGIDQGYAPVQPIHYSHKIHAGDNQIDCNYCHSSARKSKTSGIPSLNVCMN